jgi:hypothetical protein
LLTPKTVLPLKIYLNKKNLPLDHDFISIQRNIEMLVFKLLVEVHMSPKSLKYKIKIYDLLSSLQSTEFSNIIINSLSYLRSNNVNIQADLNSKIGLDDKKDNLS